MGKNKKITMGELKYRVSEFKKCFINLKIKYNDLKLLYESEVLDDLIKLENQEFENLLDSLLDFQKIFYRNVKLKEMNFRYRLWKMHLKGNNLYFISENNSLKYLEVFFESNISKFSLKSLKNSSLFLGFKNSFSFSNSTNFIFK